MRRSWRLLGAWLALAVGGAAGIGGTALASLWLSTPLAALAGGGIAAVSGVAVGHASKWIDRQHTLRRELPNRIAIQDRTGRLPRVRDVTNPIALGVHPAESRSDHPQETLAGVAPYIPRDIDEVLREAIHQESLVVVVGESTAGKSRAAFEAIRAACPDHLLAVPSGRESLPAVVAQLTHLRRCILWLDDLERFLGPDGLTRAMIASLTTSTRVHTTIVATLRTSEYERFTSRAEASLDDQGRAFWRASRDILRGAYIITLSRLWSQEELSLAAPIAEKDPRIALALKHAKTFGVAESLAAGPELLSDWGNAWAPGSHARGAALVAAAVDCRRAGLNDPVPHDLLLELHHHYLLARGGPALRPESVDEAWAWALRPVHGASSLLIPAGLGDAGPTYLAFDYLIDQPEHTQIPTDTWNILLARTNRSQAWQIAYEAYWRARTAFHAAVDSGAVDDVGSRSSATADRGNYVLAIQLLKHELEKSATNSAADNRGLQHQIAVNLMLSGRIHEAEAIFESLLLEAERTLPPEDEYLQVVRHNLASCMGQRGNLPEALARFRRILRDRERYLGPEAMNTLATRGAIAGLIAKMGNPSEALRQTRDILADEVRALGKDHTNTFETRRSLARYLALTGDVDSAIDALQSLLPDLERALGADHPEVLDTRWDLARYHRQRGNRPQAKPLFEEVLADRERMHGPETEGTRQARHEFAEFLAQPD